MIRLCVFLAVTLALGITAERVWADTPESQAADTQVSDKAELWLVNTRCAPSCDWQSIKNTELDYQRLDAQQCWASVDRDAFFASGSADVPTCFYVHGNRVNSCDAMSEGQSLYGVLRDAAGNRPFRLVVWSWPATQIRGRIRNDVKIKAARSDVQAYYLARCVDRISPDVPVAMMGHSFGARVITGALHMLAGGEVVGRGLEPRADRPKRRVRAVLIAAAADNGWLLPGWRNGLALEQVDQMLITRNTNDRVLRWYPRMYGRGGPEALGYTGPACRSQLGENGSKVETLGVGCSVGQGHGWGEYLSSCNVRCRLPWYAFLETSSASDETLQPTPAKAESSSQPEPTPVPKDASPKDASPKPSAI